jgi:hypothetical protein
MKKFDSQPAVIAVFMPQPIASLSNQAFRMGAKLKETRKWQVLVSFS